MRAKCVGIGFIASIISLSVQAEIIDQYPAASSEVQVTIIGGISTYSAQVSDYVKGVDMSGARFPAMGTYTDANIVVELPDAAN